MTFFLLTCAAFFFAIWRRSVAAGWCCWFILEFIHRLVADVLAVVVR